MFLGGATVGPTITVVSMLTLCFHRLWATGSSIIANLCAGRATKTFEGRGKGRVSGFRFMHDSKNTPYSTLDASVDPVDWAGQGGIPT